MNTVKICILDIYTMDINTLDIHTFEVYSRNLVVSPRLSMEN